MNSVVETSHGKLRGIEERGVCVFRGIPYAQPPVGELRFRSPVPPQPWTGVRDASRFGPAAPQNAALLGPLLGLGVGQMSEDCLSLNIWTPKPDGGRRPVLVWIHGGAFILGAGSQTLYEGSVLARRGDVVVVTINYRLGALGFLHLKGLCGDALPASGNEGLLDQIAALEWVRDEIAAFGGDPTNVTIFGESAGAMSCATLLGAPRAQGLFHRAILQSGSANYVSPPEDATRIAAELLSELDCSPGQAAKLRERPAERIVEAQQHLFLTLRPPLHRVRRVSRILRPVVLGLRRLLSPLTRRLRGLGLLALPMKLFLLPLTLLLRGLRLALVTVRRHRGGLPFQPVIDGAVLPRHPFETVKAGLPNRISILVGTNLDEAKLFQFMDPQARKLDEAALIARCEESFPGTDAQGLSYGRRAVEVYRQARAARAEPTEPPALWFAIESDRTMRYPAMRLAELQSAHQPQTYAYLFTWTSPFLGGVFGACHALELPFVFGTLDRPLVRGFTGVGPEADALAARIQDAWIAFARTGNPSHPGIGEWPAYDARRRATMILGPRCRVEEAPRETERAFWTFWDGTFR
jgi:para-nitrobenzyl esterase